MVCISKIISPKEWGMHPARYKKHSQPFEPQNYNYFDYQNVWTNAFFFQNDTSKHSWFLLWERVKFWIPPMVFTQRVAYLLPQNWNSSTTSARIFVRNFSINTKFLFSQISYHMHIFKKNYIPQTRWKQKCLLWLVLQSHCKSRNPSKVYVPEVENCSYTTQDINPNRCLPNSIFAIKINCSCTID